MTTSANEETAGFGWKGLLYLAIWLALPYVLVGVFWADAHHHHLAQLHGVDAAASYVGEVIAWPVLIVADVNLE
ncbi:MAG TPA: hypothetical protein VNS46_14895 [Nocardioides sp.]|nr:hypothetical protein [Nocardioides sp.]